MKMLSRIGLAIMLVLPTLAAGAQAEGDVAEISHAYPAVVKIFKSYFTVKSRHDVEATKDHFRKDVLAYADATRLGYQRIRIRAQDIRDLYAALGQWKILSDAHYRWSHEMPPSPNRLRWNPLPLPESGVDFVDGLITYAGNGDVAAGIGIGMHLYAANRDMDGRVFFSADGELLIVPQEGRLRLQTEFGGVEVAPLQIALVPTADLRGTGTISSADQEGFGSLLEIKRGRELPVMLPTGEIRAFLADSDEILLSAMASASGFVPIGFGECRGTVRPTS